MRIAAAVICLALSAASAAAQDANAPYTVYPAAPAVIGGPLLLDVGQRSVEVVWLTDSDYQASVAYGEQALDHIAVRQTDGLIPVGRVHRITLGGLEPGHTYQYQLVSTRVVRIRPYWPDKGQTAHSPVNRFATLDASRPTAAFSFITDTHEDGRHGRGVDVGPHH